MSDKDSLMKGYATFIGAVAATIAVWTFFAHSKAASSDQQSHVSAEVSTQPTDGQMSPSDLYSKAVYLLNTKKDYANAAPLLEQACNGKIAYACGTLGDLYEFARLGPKDHAHASRYYEMANPLYEVDCRNGIVVACEDLAEANRYGAGVFIDNVKVAYYAEKGCDANLKESCDLMGETSTGGNQRVSFYTKACGLGEAHGCEHVYEFYAHGDEGVQKDLETANMFLQKACNLDSEYCSSFWK